MFYFCLFTESPTVYVYPVLCRTVKYKVMVQCLVIFSVFFNVQNPALNILPSSMFDALLQFFVSFITQQLAHCRSSCIMLRVMILTQQHTLKQEICKRLSTLLMISLLFKTLTSDQQILFLLVNYENAQATFTSLPYACLILYVLFNRCVMLLGLYQVTLFSIQLQAYVSLISCSKLICPTQPKFFLCICN